MSERLPYEERLTQQWDALPLPDENLAWVDMKRRLDEDEDRKPIAWWRRGCMLWGFLLLGLLAGGWLLFRPDKWLTKKKEQQQTSTTIENKKRIEISTSTTDTAKLASNRMDTFSQNLKNVQTQGKINFPEKGINKDQETHVVNQNHSTGVSVEKSKNKTVKLAVTKRRDRTSETKNFPVEVQMDRKSNEIKTIEPAEKQKTIVGSPFVPGTDSSVTSIDITVRKTDTAALIVKKDTVSKLHSPNDTVLAAAKESKSKSKEKKPIFFSAGLAMHQQLPVAGQEFTPYNALGRKGSLADYIPSVYFRLNKEDRWFLQAEFRYGAPQLNKGIIYDQQAIPDTGQNPQFTTYTSLKLRKTFYHQLPLTFNYFVTPNWSVGGGVQWNLFKGAVAENESYVSFVQGPPDTLRQKFNQVIKKDSARQFAKNYFLGVAETEYKWKRLSAGARFAFGLQPYLRFSLPGGPVQQQRSTSLQIFLRYQFWRSKE